MVDLANKVTNFIYDIAKNRRNTSTTPKKDLNLRTREGGRDTRSDDSSRFLSMSGNGKTASLEN